LNCLEQQGRELTEIPRSTLQDEPRRAAAAACELLFLCHPRHHRIAEPFPCAAAKSLGAGHLE
jgi:hypothetical protein